MIPDGWTESTVGKSYKICNNLRFPINLEDRKGMKGIYPYYGPTGILNFIDEYRLDGEYALIGEDGDHFLKYNNKSMTLLVNGKINVNNHAHIIQGDVNSRTDWFYYYFMNRPLTPYLTRQGAGRYKLTKSALENIPILIPPLLEQCRIAEMIGVWDESIDLLERLIGRVRSRKQGLMQQLLTGKKRFKEFEGSEWKTVNLSDLCSLITKGTTPSSVGFEFCNEGINYIKIETINDRGQFLTEKVAKISDEAYQALKRSQLRELDILFSIAGALGRVAIVNDNILPANTNQALAIIRLKEEYRNCHEYLFQYLKSEIITKHIECVNVQAAQANLSLNQINNFKIIFPSFPEQEKIAAVLSAADEEISTLEKQLAAYKQQKLGLMQQLLTGRIRIGGFKDGQD